MNGAFLLEKKILIIAPQPFLQWRGTPLRVYFTLVSLAKLGYKIDLLTLPVGQDAQIEGVNVVRVANPLKIRNVKIGPSPSKVFFDVLIFFKGLQLVRKSKYSIIHGIEEAGIIALILASLKGSKVVYEKHSDPFSHKNGLLKNLFLYAYSMIEKMLVRKVDAIICTGIGLVGLVKQVKGANLVFHISDVPSSIVEPSAEDALKVRRKFPVTSDAVIITYVGSFAGYQGISLLIKTIPLVLKESHKARFLIVGGTPDEVHDLKNEPGLLEYADSLIFVGTVPPDEIPVLLKASDILLSLRQAGANTPLKLLDYLKSGKAVVATDVIANRLILNEKCAIFAKADPDSFASAIRNLADDPVKRQEMGVEARKHFTENYSFDRFMNEIGECYQKTLDC